MLRTSMIVLAASAALIAGVTTDALAYGGGGFSRGGFGASEHTGAGFGGVHVNDRHFAPVPTFYRCSSPNGTGYGDSCGARER